MRILSYTGSYLRERPTVDRIAETVEKISEDLYDRMMPPAAERDALVRLGEPVLLGEHLTVARRRPRHAVGALTKMVERAVQDGLDELNRGCSSPGSRPFSWRDDTRRH